MPQCFLYPYSSFWCPNGLLLGQGQAQYSRRYCQFTDLSPPLPSSQQCRCCCEVSETIFIIVVVVVCKKISQFYCSPSLFYVKMAPWSIVVRLAIAMLFTPIIVAYICSLIRLGQVRFYAAMLFKPIFVSYICSLIRLGQVRLYDAMLFIPIFIFLVP